MRKELICGSCGTKQSTDNFTTSEVYFPNRMIYTNYSLEPLSCVNCRYKYNMIVFGENIVSFAFNPELNNNVDVLQNNHLYAQLTKK